MTRGKQGIARLLIVALVGMVVLAGVAFVVINIGAAFLWGAPLLQERSDSVAIQEQRDSLETVGEAVAAAAQRGTRESASFTVDEGRLHIMPEQDLIEYTVATETTSLPVGRWIPLNTDNMRGIEAAGQEGYGIYGRDQYDVLIGKARRTEEGYRSIYRLAFRDLQRLESETLYRIDLRAPGKQTITEGRWDITVRRTDTVRTTNASTGATTVRRVVTVRLEN